MTGSLTKSKRDNRLYDFRLRQYERAREQTILQIVEAECPNPPKEGECLDFLKPHDAVALTNRSKTKTAQIDCGKYSNVL